MERRDDNALATPGHEPIETDVRAVWRTGAALVGVVVAALLLIAGMMTWLDDAEGDPGTDKVATTDLIRDGQNPLAQLHDQQQRWLKGHAWVDREAGIARVPIDRAMEIISRNGLPATLSGTRGNGANSTKPSHSEVAPPTDKEGAEP
jgi:hypothetical protein